MMGSNTETDHSKMEMDHSMHGDMQHESMDMPGEMKMTGNPRPLPPYKDLRALESTELPSQNKDRVVVLNLTGDMERYVWSINGMTLNENDKILIRKGENVTFVMNNKTMMHHPMHLHGHFFRVLNDQGEYSPLKHTVDVSLKQMRRKTGFSTVMSSII